jgi:hypothetical protein
MSRRFNRRFASMLAALAPAAVAAFILASPAAASDSIYWGNQSGNSLSVAALNGSGGSDLATGETTVSQPVGTAIDATTGRIYWADALGSAIKYANLDGTDGGGTLDTTGATVNGIRGMVLDLATGRIYWANQDGNTISYANLDGSGGDDLDTTGATTSGPTGIAIDAAAGRIYWANANSAMHAISSAKLDGSGGGADLDTTGAPAPSAPVGPSLDGAGKVYWANLSTNELPFASLSGGGGGQLSTTGSSVSGEYGTALDAAAGKIYWGNLGSPQISFANLNNSGGGDLATSGATKSSPLFPSLLEKPSNTSVPGVTGTPIAGNDLSCSNAVWAADDLGGHLYRASAGFTYQWLKDNSPISGATDTTYTVQPSDGNHQIKCRVTASNFAGPTSATSTATTIQAKPANTALPTISGTPVAGHNLTCNNGTWTGTAPIEYSHQWLRNNVAISGATSATYMVKAADVGKQLKCRVTAGNELGSTMATSAATTIKTPPANTVAPKITGTPKVGKTLTCTKGTWTGSAPITYKYQWLRNGSPIAGSTAATYVAKAADQSKMISCKVTATNAAGTAFKVSAAVKVT